MKKYNSIFAALCLVVFAIACAKDGLNSATIPMVPVSVTIEDSEIPQTKVSHTWDGTESKHKIAWASGDQFSMYGYLTNSGVEGHNQYEVFNFSDYRFTLRSGYKSTFDGYMPDFMGTFGSGKTINHYAVHPAASFDVEHGNGAVFNATPKPSGSLSIPTTQDGTGWSSCIYLSRTASTGTSSNSINSLKFSLGNCLLRLKVKANKNITQITIAKGSGGIGYLVGPITKLQGNAESIWISSGCLTTTLTVENGGNLVTADSGEFADLYFAVRKLQKDVPYTFTFTASDNSTLSNTLTPKADYDKGVFSLGEKTLSFSD